MGSREFFRVKRPSEVYPMLDRFGPAGTEETALDRSLDRVLAEDVFSTADIPAFDRSTVDGYALKADDTFGASEGSPVLLVIVGEVMMGMATETVISHGEVTVVPTGGMIPQGADAVVMLEFSERVDERTIQIKRPVSPLENVMEQGEDFKAGDRVISRGHRLRPQDMGVMAALGKAQVPVYKRPRVAIVSSGDEIVDITAEPRLGQIRDVNRYTVSGQVEMAGGIPLFVGIAHDSLEKLRSLSEMGLEAGDMLVISGGSSVGTLDWTIEVIESLPESQILVHGLSLRPGKPTVIGRSRGKPIIGLPGHPVSAMVVFDLFIRPLIWRLSGYNGPTWPLGREVSAILTRNISSPPGREDYVRVRLEEREGRILAHPVLGKSGAISTMVHADGMIRIDIDSEGLDEGAPVTVLLF